MFLPTRSARKYLNNIFWVIMIRQHVLSIFNFNSSKVGMMRQEVDNKTTASTFYSAIKHIFGANLGILMTMSQRQIQCFEHVILNSSVC